MTHKRPKPSSHAVPPPSRNYEPSAPAPGPAAPAPRASRTRFPHVVVREIARADADQRRVRARGTRDAVGPGEQIRTMVFAPQNERAAWIESELSRAPISISIQVGRRVRTVVSALVRDPPPRPHVLIVDFDAVSPAELLELHAIRHEGWTGRVIGLGNVPSDLRASLDVDQVIPTPPVRDSLLDCVAGTGHASATVPIPAHMLAELTPGGRSRR
jgi:hypothetical protein